MALDHLHSITVKPAPLDNYRFDFCEAREEFPDVETESNLAQDDLAQDDEDDRQIKGRNMTADDDQDGVSHFSVRNFSV